GVEARRRHLRPPPPAAPPDGIVAIPSGGGPPSGLPENRWRVSNEIVPPCPTAPWSRLRHPAGQLRPDASALWLGAHRCLPGDSAGDSARQQLPRTPVALGLRV